MTTTETELQKILSNQIDLCNEMVDKLFDRFQKNKISKEDYYPKIQKWDDKKYQYINELNILQNEKNT